MLFYFFYYILNAAKKIIIHLYVTDLKFIEISLDDKKVMIKDFLGTTFESLCSIAKIKVSVTYG